MKTIRLSKHYTMWKSTWFLCNMNIMENIKISLFKELYYWMYFYVSKILKRIDRCQSQNPYFAASVHFTALRMLNVVSISILVEYLLKDAGFEYDQSVINKFCSIYLYSWYWIWFISQGKALLSLKPVTSFRKNDESQVKSNYWHTYCWQFCLLGGLIMFARRELVLYSRWRILKYPYLKNCIKGLSV
jgi:hypothetical protein